MTKKKKQQPDRPEPDQPESDRPELDYPLNTALESDAAIDAEAESAAAANDTFEQAADEPPAAGLEISEVADGDEEAPEPPAQLERLQKILAKSGIASRRHAEELITSGRVQVNGKVVTELGTKADPQRDHIRVDGKLLQGSERHRYFMLNKPKGYVTTVSDPEGRPTIMEFFSKTRERLYPVGRLDYLSEGLLLVTNDGELANKLTRAASNVEKTYLVKVSGQPSEEELQRLREGVGIQKGKPGSGRVQTAPAEIRPFRPAKPRGQRGSSPSTENPWYEVVLIEGRNRELRKMFEEIGHHVEKIRRVGYGPLVLDLEPGNIRELEPVEVENLRRAAEGKYRKPKPREPRSREYTQRSDRPASTPRWNQRRSEAGNTRRTGDREERRPFREHRRNFGQRPASGPRRAEGQQFRSGGDEQRREFRPASRSNPRFSEDRPQRPPRRDDREARPFSGARENRGRFTGRPGNREDRTQNFGSRPPRRDFGAPSRPEGDRSESSRRFEDRRFEGRPQQRSGGSRPFRRERPDDRENRPGFDRPRPDDRSSRGRDENRPPRRDRPQFRNEQPRFDRPRREGRDNPTSGSRSERPDRRSDRGPDRPGQRPSTPRPAGNFKQGNRGPAAGKQGSVRSGGGRRSGPRPGSNRPKRRP